MSKCGEQYSHTQTHWDKYTSGISHFLNEKGVFTTVHPLWVILLAFFSCYFTQSHIERLLIVTFAFYSILLEMMNSSIEITNDRFGCEYNEHTKIAKELSGSVTALSRIPLLLLCSIILYRNVSSCNQVMACS